MMNMPSRRQLIRTTGLGALAAAISGTEMIAEGSAFQTPDVQDTQPLPDPTNDKDAYNSAKQYIQQRFTNQLLIKQIDYGLTLDKLRSQAPLKLTILSRNVEQLAQQCGSLLERGIATRSEYEAVAEKDLATLTELAEFLLRDAEFQNEAELGYYGLDYRAASADEMAASAYVAGFNNQAAGPIKDSLKPESDSEAKRADFLQRRTTYERNTIPTRRVRAQAARQSYALKVLSYSQPRAPNNYPSRLDVLQRRFLLDFASAAARVSALSKGLQEIYGYDQAPLVSTSGNLFDDALIWLRNVAEFLVSFGATDQGYTLPVSVRSIVGASAWTGAFSKGIGQISFSIAEDLFPQQQYVRLRGLSVYAKTSDPAALYSVALQAPQKSYIRHRDNTQVPLIQDALVTRLGRVQSRNSVRDGDIVGAVTLNNVSPFGEWALSVTDNYPSLQKGVSQRYGRGMVKPLDDIVVDLHVSVQQVSTTT